MFQPRNILYILLALTIAANFYMDHQRMSALQTRLSKMDSTISLKADEPSPFETPVMDNSHDMMPPILDSITAISFERSSHDFGRVESGPKYSTTFKFTNTGKKPLIISAAEGSCGCTVPTWPKAAIEPGGTGEINVEFDSKGRSGQQTKTVTSNTSPPTNVLTIKCLPYHQAQ